MSVQDTFRYLQQNSHYAVQSGPIPLSGDLDPVYYPPNESVREHLPEADGNIVFDKFHVAKHLGDAADKVRRKENKTLRASGDHRLAGTRYDWAEASGIDGAEGPQGIFRTQKH